MSETVAQQTAEATAEAAVTKAKKASKSKVTTGNFLVDTAQEVENMTKEKCLKRASELYTDIEANYFILGGLLSIILKEGWFEGYETFDQFVQNEYGFQVRKAKYLIQIYSELVDKQIPWEKVAHLGWTKVKDLATTLTLENLEDWVAKAEKLTVVELQAALKASSSGKTETEASTDNIHKVKINLINDQYETYQSAINKAKAEAHTDHDNVAIENICMAYLGNATQGGTTQSLEAQMGAAGMTAVLAAFEANWPDVVLTVEQ